MSTINDALKKAQKDKDAWDAVPGGGIPETSGRRGNASFRRRLAWVALLVLGGAALAYAAYTRIGPGAREAPMPPKPAPETPGPAAPAPPATAAQPATPAPASDGFYEKARAFQQQGLFRDARKWYTQALDADPGHVRALNNLGVLLLQQGEYDQARERLEKAARLDPANADPVYNLACLHALSGDTDRSLAYLTRAAALNPRVRVWAREDADLRSLRGLAPFERLVEK